jgi:type IV pilus assembly protein PilM
MASAKTSRRTVTGLDIEPGHVTAVQVSVNGSITVDKAATATLTPDVVRDGEVNDVESLANTLRELFREHRLDKRVRLGVANQRIVLRTIDLPPLADRKDLDAAVRFQAQEQIPMPLDQAVLDWASLGRVQTEHGERERAVLVAARRDMVERLLGAARSAGLRPEGIDLAAFAMIRALGTSGDSEPTLYVNVAGVTNLAVGEGTSCRFTRIVVGGYEGLVAALAERRGLTLEHSRMWLSHVGLSAPVDTVDGDPEIVAEARAVLAEGTHRVADEVRNSLDYYRQQEHGTDVARALLTGPAVSIPGFADQLAADLGIPVEVRAVRESRAGAFGGIEPGQLTVAAGLAVEEMRP